MTDKSPTKVLFSTFDVVPEPTGTSVRSTAVLESLGNYFDLDVLTAKTPNHAHIERFHGARLLRVPVGSEEVRARAEAFDRAVRRQLQSEEYAAVQFTDPFGGYALCELRPNYGYKLIYDVRSFPSVELRYTEPHLEGDRKFLTKLRRQEIFCLMNADQVLVPCRPTFDHITSLGVPAEKIQMLPPPVDLARFSVETTVDNDPCRFLYIGSHASWQGLPSLLFALKKAAERTEFEVRIVGPSHGSWRQQLEDMVREFGLRQAVKIEHPVPHDEVPELLEWADVGLAPLMKVDRNMSQGSAPLKIAEYLVAGRPVLAANLPMCREMIEEGLSGLLFPANDEDALADCVVRLASEPDLRVTMGREARARGCARYDLRSFKSRLRQVYHSLMSPIAAEGQESFVLGHTPTGNQAPNDPRDPTVTLPAGARPEEPPPDVPAHVEPPTQTSLPLDAIPQVAPTEEDTGSVNVEELPWSGARAEDESESESDADTMGEDSSPAPSVDDEGTPSPGEVPAPSDDAGEQVAEPSAPHVDDEETPLPSEGVVPPYVAHPGDDSTPTGAQASVRIPVAEDETPMPASSGPSSKAEAGQKESLPSVIVADSEAKAPAAAAEHEEHPQSPNPNAEPREGEGKSPEEKLATEQTSSRDVEPEHSLESNQQEAPEPSEEQREAQPGVEPEEAASSASREPPRQGDAGDREITQPKVETAPAKSSDEEEDPDEPVEIDPDDAILLDDVGLPEQGSESSSEKARVDDLPESMEKPAVPVVRGVIMGDTKPAPKTGAASANGNRRKTGEDTNPGIKG